MKYDRRLLGEKAKELGFVRDTLEKVYRLTEILRFINTHPLLKENLILKGGTAINLTVFNLPRLSVDIDLDLAQNLQLQEMEQVRKHISETIQRYMSVNEYELNTNSKSRHSLDSWVYTYVNSGGNRDNIKIEINYSLRSHIFLPVNRPIVTSVTENEVYVKTLVPIELFAAKMNALMNRAAVRDLYDINNMIYFDIFDETDYEMLRKCVVFYAAISAETINKSFDTSEIDNITFLKVRRDLFPVIAKKDNFDLDKRKEKAKEFIGKLMNLTNGEKEFLDNFENRVYRPELIFKDEGILFRLKDHPMVLWKMQVHD